MGAAMTQNDREFAVVLLNEDGSIMDAQPTCASTLGWTREELIGKDVGELLSSGRDVLLSQLPRNSDAADPNESTGENTSISVRVLARKKDQSEFAARVTIRRFTELGCWTLAFYCHPSDLESTAPPTVSAEEISLAKKAREEAPAAGRKSMPFWQNSRLLFSSRKKAEAPLKEEAPAPSRNSMTTIVTEPRSPGIPAELPSLPEPAQDADLERQYQATVAALARLKGDIERERGERARAEQRAASLATQVKALHVQLSESLAFEGDNQKRISTAEEEARHAREELARCKLDLEKEAVEQKAAEEQVKVLRELNARLEASGTTFNEARKAFDAKRGELEQQIQSGRQLIRQTEAALEEEMKSRQETDLKLGVALRAHREQEDASKSRVDQLEAALLEKELRCKGLEEEVLRVRSEAIESGRMTRSASHQLRGRCETLAQALNRTTSRLLQAGLAEEQKPLVESLLQDVLALESALREKVEAQTATV